MTDTTYNGWTNYETWAVNLWLDNDQGSQEYWREIAEEIYRDSAPRNSLTRRDVATYDLADRLKSEVADNAPDLGASLYSDLLGAALSEANYDEIARHMIDDVADEIDANEAD